MCLTLSASSTSQTFASVDRGSPRREIQGMIALKGGVQEGIQGMIDANPVLVMATSTCPFCVEVRPFVYFPRCGRTIILFPTAYLVHAKHALCSFCELWSSHSNNGSTTATGMLFLGVFCRVHVLSCFLERG